MTTLQQRWTPAQIEIQYANEDIANVLLRIISNSRESFDCCIDQDEVTLIIENEKLWDAIKALKNRGSRVRFVTKVKEGTISSCKQMTKLGDVFHNEMAKGTFQIIDGNDYLCYFLVDQGNAMSIQKYEHRLFHTNNKAFVNIQQCLFDNLCNNAVTVKEKIKEIERGIRTDFADTINDPAEIRNIVNNQIMSAKEELLLLFSTTNSFYRAMYSGMLNLLQHVPSDVNIKVLIQASDRTIDDSIQQGIKESRKKVQIQYLSKPMQKKIVTIVVDQSTSVAIEIKDDTKKTLEEASGAAIYSNSELTVSSCISIFETLWIQSELEKQNKIKHAYFQMFKGFDLKDETYVRRWASEQKEKIHKMPE
ncbi:hypothetical protein [Nitrososphaera sp. AFS]|jgi:hypothetical protein|uniref:hypothetical protein n=1 Tax=Nitrososphaera sp. AFS TaxID=2301191 RepID=UPI0013922992|nr:hypothetical protein [Nitrososphaera sp. AFS]NAL77590.1 hypothetical protein [Nitrososphaera sp. AFS]